MRIEQGEGFPLCCQSNSRLLLLPVSKEATWPTAICLTMWWLDVRNFSFLLFPPLPKICGSVRTPRVIGVLCCVPAWNCLICITKCCGWRHVQIAKSWRRAGSDEGIANERVVDHWHQLNWKICFWNNNGIARKYFLGLRNHTHYITNFKPVIPPRTTWAKPATD